MKRSIPYWIAALQDRCFVMRCTAVRALGEMGQTDQEARAALLQAVRDPEPAVRAEAVEALDAVGPTAEGVVLALAGARNDSNVFVRRAAGKALKDIEAAQGVMVT